jgi:serine/threonine protein kinase
MENDSSSATDVAPADMEERSDAIEVIDFDIGEAAGQTTALVEDAHSERAPASGNHIALAVGTKLLEYVIERVLGSGGFGIGYLARDTNLLCEVAIKEYLPSDLAVRLNGNTVCARTDSDTHGYMIGLDRFLAETRVLAGFRHPNIVRVLRFFEANNTAYMVMEYEKGESLSKWLLSHGPIGEADLLRMFLPLLEGLEVVHKSGMLHRDIKPGNIYVRDADGSLVLLDFGAARCVAEGASRSMTSLVTPGYAPFEQYQTRGDQGPWSDIYAMGAVLYWVTTGEKPFDAPSRIKKDDMPTAVAAGKGRYSETLLAAIDRALAMDEKRRPRSVAEFRAALLGEAPVEATRAPMPMAAPRSVEDITEDRTVTVPVAQKPPRKAWLVGGVAAVALAVVAAGAYMALPSQPRPAQTDAATAAASVEAAPAEAAAPVAAAPVADASQAAAPKTAAPRGTPAASSARDKVKSAAPDAARAPQREPAAAAPTMATMSFAIQPAGARCELHIDGVGMGIIESSRDIRVAPGKHKIELRRVDWPGTYYGSVELKANESKKIPVTFSSL